MAREVSRVTQSELNDLLHTLTDWARYRPWSWTSPLTYNACLRSWPPGYLAALALWHQIPWRLQQVSLLHDAAALEPALARWRDGLGFHLELLGHKDYTEEEFRLLARAAPRALAFLEGLLWGVDPELAAADREAIHAVFRRRYQDGQQAAKPDYR